MRRADRLFQIIQILRRTRRPVTADAIAAELETSKRSVYRDIADLMAQRVPIRGEAGVGYVLEGGFDLPPLMLTPDEIEAAVLGAQWVVAPRRPGAGAAPPRTWSPRSPPRCPSTCGPYVLEPATGTPPAWKAERRRDRHGPASAAPSTPGARSRSAIATSRGARRERIIWPVAVGYMRRRCACSSAWCELRNDFRSFRTDRIAGADFLDERYPERAAVLRARWLKAMQARHQARTA